MMMIAMTKRLSGRVEALTCIVEKSRGLDFNHMRDPQDMMRIRAGLIVVALLVAWPPLVNAEEPAPILLEAIILDETCNPSCIGEQPSHVVEFFSADWCDPCRSVESMLRNGTHQEDQVLILTHHPSPADALLLSYSLPPSDPNVPTGGHSESRGRWCRSCSLVIDKGWNWMRSWTEEPTSPSIRRSCRTLSSWMGT